VRVHRARERDEDLGCSARGARGVPSSSIKNTGLRPPTSPSTPSTGDCAQGTITCQDKLCVYHEPE